MLLLGLLVLFAGLELVRSSGLWGFTWAGAVKGVVSQLGTTAPAAVLVAVATALNIAVGAIVLRLLGVAPFRSLSDLVMGGFAAAVVLDSASLFLLGSVGLFGWPELLLLQAAVVVAYLILRRRMPLMTGPLRFRWRRPPAWWFLVVAIWAGPLILQLASPVVPFMDVLPNHVAPVEHVSVFGSFATLTTSPSPIYGPSRLMLGYVGLLGDLATVTRLHAALAVAAFALPLTVLCAMSMRRLATALFGGSAGFWVLLTFPLTFTFMRIPDARDTVVVFPLAALALTLVAQRLRAAPDRATVAGASAPALRRSRRPDLVLTFAFGAAALVHPLAAVLLVTAAAAATILAPSRLARDLVPAIGGGVVLALPQVATMLGLAAPAWVGFVCIAVAVAVAVLLAAIVGTLADRAASSSLIAEARRRVPPATGPALLIAAIVVLLLIGSANLSAIDDLTQELMRDFPRLTIGCLAGAVIAARRPNRGWLLLGCGVAAGVAALAASGFVGSRTLTEQAIHYEVPKAVQYWLPVMLALGAAGGVAALCRLRGIGVVRYIAIGIGLVLILYPTTQPLATDTQIGEHRAAESVGLALREAERGYWNSNSTGHYPDPRLIVDPARQQVVDELRAEEAAGRLGPSTRVLHIAFSFQEWISVPIGVFTGAMETSISSYPEVSIHTEGGRLLGFESLTSELASDYGYVVLEPAGLPSDLVHETEAEIAADGYRQIWTNSQATIYARN